MGPTSFGMTYIVYRDLTIFICRSGSLFLSFSLPAEKKLLPFLLLPEEKVDTQLYFYSNSVFYQNKAMLCFDNRTPFEDIWILENLFL